MDVTDCDAVARFRHVIDGRNQSRCVVPDPGGRSNVATSSMDATDRFASFSMRHVIDGRNQSRCVIPDIATPSMDVTDRDARRSNVATPSMDATSRCVIPDPGGRSYVATSSMDATDRDASFPTRGVGPTQSVADSPAIPCDGFAQRHAQVIGIQRALLHNSIDVGGEELFFLLR